MWFFSLYFVSAIYIQECGMRWNHLWVYISRFFVFLPEFRVPMAFSFGYSVFYMERTLPNHRSICISVILLCILFEFSVSKTDLAYKAIDIRVNHYNISEADKIEYSLDFTYQKCIVAVWNTAKKNHSRFKSNDMVLVTVFGLTFYSNVRTPTHSPD